MIFAHGVLAHEQVEPHFRLFFGGKGGFEMAVYVEEGFSLLRGAVIFAHQMEVVKCAHGTQVESDDLLRELLLRGRV